MKIVSYLRVLLFFYLLIQSCGDKDNQSYIKDEIPPEDRFVFIAGDTLLYNCSDGCYDTFLIRDSRFWTESGSATGWMGGITNWERQFQRVVIESYQSTWNDFLVYDRDEIDYPFYIIETIDTNFDDNGNPVSWVINGSTIEGEIIFAQSDVTYPEISFNGHLFKKVYFSATNREDTSFKVYWNLKYGIIRFEGVINGTENIWDLEL